MKEEEEFVEPTALKRAEKLQDPDEAKNPKPKAKRTPRQEKIDWILDKAGRRLSRVETGEVFLLLAMVGDGLGKVLDGLLST